MNRAERRRFAALGTAPPRPTPIAGLQSPGRNTGPVSDALKEKIAAAVTSFVGPYADGGGCSYAALVGLRALGLLDISGELGICGLMLRVGPRALADVLGFTDSAGLGARDGHDWKAHFLVTRGDEIIDFSVGQLRVGHERAVAAGKSPPMQWAIGALPAFLWEPLINFTPPTDLRRLPLARPVITEFRDRPVSIDELKAPIEAVRMIEPLIRERLQAAGLSVVA